MVYPMKKVSFYEVKKIITQECKIAIEEIKRHVHIEGKENQRMVSIRIKNLRDNIIRNIEDAIL